MEKAKEFQKNIYFCFIDYAKAFVQVSQEAGQVVWYSHLLKNFPQFLVIHTVNVSHEMGLSLRAPSLNTVVDVSKMQYLDAISKMTE